VRLPHGPGCLSLELRLHGHHLKSAQKQDTDPPRALQSLKMIGMLGHPDPVGRAPGRWRPASRGAGGGVHHTRLWLNGTETIGAFGRALLVMQGGSGALWSARQCPCELIAKCPQLLKRSLVHSPEVALQSSHLTLAKPMRITMIRPCSCRCFKCSDRCGSEGLCTCHQFHLAVSQTLTHAHA
jgi:hypothetical protein